MLKIRQEQCDVMAKGEQDRFKQRLQRELRTEYTQKVAAMSEQQLKEFVETGVNKATAYNIVVKCEVMDYLVILLHHGVDFEQQPEHKQALSILIDPVAKGDSKLLQLENLLVNSRDTHLSGEYRRHF